MNDFFIILFYVMVFIGSLILPYLFVVYYILNKNFLFYVNVIYNYKWVKEINMIPFINYTSIIFIFYLKIKYLYLKNKYYDKENENEKEDFLKKYDPFNEEEWGEDWKDKIEKNHKKIYNIFINPKFK